MFLHLVFVGVHNTVSDQNSSDIDIKISIIVEYLEYKIRDELSCIVLSSNIESVLFPWGSFASEEIFKSGIKIIG